MRRGHQGARDICGYNTRSLAAGAGEPVRWRACSGARRMVALAAARGGGAGVRGAAAYHRVSEYGHDSTSEGRGECWSGADIRDIAHGKNGRFAWRRRNDEDFGSSKREPNA